jgi:N-hydroxyarylamine O-acetyltransferase
VFDLDRYLARIGLSGRPSLAEIHFAHVVSIPFENLDPHRGITVSLDDDDLGRKLVDERRGGYCFEHNLLLAAALTALGAEVDLYLARVRLGRPPGTVSPRTHLVLGVQQDGQRWLADVGFGAGTLLEPIPFGPGVAHEQEGWRFRVIQAADEFVFQTTLDGEWTDVHAFVPQPVPRIDVELSNWFTSTYPRSPFVTGLMIAAHHRDGSRVLLSDREQLAVTEQTPSGSTVTPVTRADVPRLLTERFGLPGFALGDGDRIVRAAGG